MFNLFTGYCICLNGVMDSITENNKVKLCVVCNANDSKYTCPKCDIRTCSLKCVRIHKKEVDCDGLGETTKYKPLEKLDVADILSDLEFLNSASSYVLKCSSDKRKQWTRENVLLPMHLHKLRKIAYNRGVTLKFLPRHFERHKNNTTFLDWNSDKLYWKVEWVFPDATDKLTLVHEKLLDSEKLYVALEGYLLPKKRRIEVMEPYYQAGCENVVILLKQEGVNKIHLLLDPAKSLRDNLAGQLIIEHPTIHVVLLSNLSSYKLAPIKIEDIKSEPQCEDQSNTDNHIDGHDNDDDDDSDVKPSVEELEGAMNVAPQIEQRGGDDIQNDAMSTSFNDSSHIIHHISKLEMQHRYKRWYDDTVGIGGITRLYKNVCDPTICRRENCTKFHCENRHHRTRSRAICAVICQLNDCRYCLEKNSLYSTNSELVNSASSKCDVKSRNRTVYSNTNGRRPATNNQRFNRKNKIVNNNDNNNNSNSHDDSVEVNETVNDETIRRGEGKFNDGRNANKNFHRNNRYHPYDKKFYKRTNNNNNNKFRNYNKFKNKLDNKYGKTVDKN